MSDPREPLAEKETDLGPEGDEAEIDEGDAKGDGEDAGDAEGGGTEVEVEDEDEPPGRVAPRARARDTIRSLRQRSQAAEREVQELRRQFDEFRTRPAAPPIDPGAQARAEAEELERVQQMLPHEVARYYAQKTERQVREILGQTTYQTQDAIDRQSFQSAMQNSPSRQRLASEVERVLASERAAGRNTQREVIYKYLLGDEVDRRAARSAPRQRQAARGRIARQTTQPQSGRGDVPRGGRERDTDAELLRNLTVGDI